MAKVLEDLGLTKSEIKVYLALLELGSSTTGPIVDKSKVSSSKIYEILEKLIQKGLVSFIIKSGTKYFDASPPNRILDYVKEKEERLTQQKTELNNLIPQLELKRKLAEDKSEATVFKGMKGIKTAFDDVLKTMKRGEEYHVIVGTEVKEPLFAFIKHYHQRRAKAGIKVKLLYSPDSIGWLETVKDVPHTITRVSNQQLLSSSFILIYKNKTLISIPEDKDITAFRLESKNAADSFRTQFNLLWNQETEVVKGLDAIQDLFDDMLNYDSADLIGARGYFVDARPKFADDWEKRAIKKKFRWRNIVDPEVKGHKVTKFSFAETKYNIPKEFASLSVFWIYGEKVVISNWMGNEPIAFIIKNKHVYEMYKKQFDSIWNKK